MFQRFTVVMEYQQKPVLPPPLIACCHFYSLLKYLIRKSKGLQETRDNGLKLFLEKDDMEKLYDFEEECVEGYFREQEIILLQSTDERIKSTDERVENMSQKIEDINQKENLQTASVQSIEFRLCKVEESAEQILSHLAVIHRFMSAHTSLQDNNMQGSITNINSEAMQVRTLSEPEPVTTLQVQAPNPRRKMNRSLTEVRPDAYIFDDGMHFEVRTVLEEDECRSQDSAEKRDRKLSCQSEDSEIFPISTIPTKLTPTEIVFKKPPPILNIRQDTTSTESRDTLTPLETSDDKTLVGDSAVDEVVEMTYDGLRQRASRRRNSSICRRNSETCSINMFDINKSQTSLHQLNPNIMTRRQVSISQSEPDSGNDQPPIKPMMPAKSGRQLLLKFHNEYTSITDDLESVCHMITSPTKSCRGEFRLNCPQEALIL